MTVSARPELRGCIAQGSNPTAAGRTSGHYEPVAAPPPPAGPDFTTGLWTRGNLLGDAGGLRSTLGSYGISFGIQDINEVWGNVSGGIRRGASYDGVTLMSIGLDTQRAFGWQGGTFNISAWNIRGRNISTDNLLNLQTVSGILASPTTRLWEIWFQQSFLDGRFNVKLGQQSLDQEFMVSQYSGLFLNTMMGWPMVPSADLYAGGPAYPLSSLGVRLRTQLGGGFAALGGVFQDNPPGGPFDSDSQLLGSTRWGGNFNLRTGALFIAELQYALNQPRTGDMDDGTSAHGLPGTYKIGMWIDTAAFPSPRFDNTGLSLADPASTGIARTLRNNFSIYAVADQMIWRPSDDSPRSVGVFARIMGAPGDRNLIDFSVNAGVALKAPLPGRDDDILTFGFALSQVSAEAVALDRETQIFTGSFFPVRDREVVLELDYTLQLAPWWTLQADLQEIFHPGGNAPSPLNPPQPIPDAFIIGGRTTIKF